MTPASAARLGAIFLTAAWLALAPRSFAGIASDHPLDDIHNVGKLMAEHPTDDVHIVLIHGIRTADRTTWNGFRALLCAHLAGQCISPTPVGARLTERLLLAPHPPHADYFGHQIWADDQGGPDSERRSADQKWMGSQPFIDHYRFDLKGGRHVIVDEINWWPLVLALKCQYVVEDDAKLAGPDKTNTGSCAADDQMRFPWFTRTSAEALLASHPLGGGAPLVNGGLKNQIMDWGITDAVLSLGTLKDFLHETVRCAFTDISALDPGDFEASKDSADPPGVHDCQKDESSSSRLAPPNTQFVIISHSLGAFLLMDTFAAAAGDANYYPQSGAGNCRVDPAPSPAARPSSEELAASAAPFFRSSQSLCFVLRKSSNLYFLANQFPLLELARAQGMSNYSGQVPDPARSRSALVLWAETREAADQRKQIVAFSDPGDILTFNVPPIEDADVINVYPHNAFSWFGLVESPAPAHVNYLTSKPVLKVLFGN